MTGSRLIIEFSHPDIMKPKPWPVAIDLETGRAISGLGNDDGALLIGFGVQGAQSVDVWFESGQEISTDLIKGLVPTFSGGGGFFEWGNPIRDARVQEPVSDKHFLIDIQMSNDAMLTGPAITAALEKVRQQVYDIQDPADESGIIKDENGQKVGTWSFVEVAR